MSDSGLSTFPPPHEMRTVTVERLPARAGETPTTVPLAGDTTLDALLETLAVPANTEAVLVNGSYVRPDYILQPGDRVTIIPFMSGG